MNTDGSRNASLHPDLDPAMQARIDAALAQVGSATPRAGLEGRIAAHLAYAQQSAAAEQAQEHVSWFSPRRLAGLAAAGAFAALAIVAGSVSHSKQVVPVAPGNTIATRPAASTGMQTADKVVEAPKPVAAPAHGRARAAHKNTADTSTTPGTPMPAAQKNQ